MQIAATPMPEEYKDKKMLVLCNDCLTKSEVPFHIIGGKCSNCRSYNTTRCEDNVRANNAGGPNNTGAAAAAAPAANQDAGRPRPNQANQEAGVVHDGGRVHEEEK